MKTRMFLRRRRRRLSKMKKTKIHLQLMMQEQRLQEEQNLLLDLGVPKERTRVLVKLKSPKEVKLTILSQINLYICILMRNDIIVSHLAGSLAGIFLGAANFFINTRKGNARSCLLCYSPGKGIGIKRVYVDLPRYSRSFFTRNPCMGSIFWLKKKKKKKDPYNKGGLFSWQSQNCENFVFQMGGNRFRKY